MAGLTVNFKHVCVCVRAISRGWMRDCVCGCRCCVSAVCQWSVQVNPTKKKKKSEQPAALPVTEHAYGHPSSCLRLCHASQEDADWFTLDPALSPLLRRLSFLPALLHLSTICSILLSLFSRMYSLISLFLHSLFTYMVTHVWATWFYFWVGGLRRNTWK